MAKSSSKSSPTIVLDLGGYNAKIGLASDERPQILSNCIFKAKSEKKRQFISRELSECKDQHQLFHMYPFSSGYLTNWDLQERILDYFFGEDLLSVNPRESNLILTEPYYNFQLLKRYYAEAVFEHYEFQSAFLCPPAYLSAYQFRVENPQEPTCFVVDSGHSFTHLVPVIDGSISWDGVIRVPVGGKILTNHLKQRITFQQINVMDETHVIHQLKELACFVSTDLRHDFRVAQDTLTRTFVLPDYVNVFAGYMKPPEETFQRPSENEQIVQLTADRFVVPEILFRPSIIGDSRKGIAEATASSIKKYPVDTQLYLFRNLVLTGGNCLFSGFKQRFLQEVSPEVPEYGEVEAVAVGDPLTAAWFGGKSLAENPTVFDQLRVTKAEYEEHGESICERKFIRCSPHKPYTN